MKIDPNLYKTVANFIVSTPLIDTKNRRKALLIRSGLGELLPEIDLTGSPFEFTCLLVEQLWTHGSLSTGQNALLALLKGIKTTVGRDQGEFSDSLCKQLEELFPEPRHSFSVSNEREEQKPNMTEMEIVDFVLALVMNEPQISKIYASPKERKDFLTQCDLEEVVPDICYEDVPYAYMQLLLDYLSEYGSLSNGRHALSTFFENLETLVENDEKKAEIRILSKQIMDKNSKTNMSSTERLSNVPTVSKNLEKLANFILSQLIDTVVDYNGRKGLLLYCGVAERMPGIRMDGTPREFVYNAVEYFYHYGPLQNGQDAFQQFLEGIEAFVGEKEKQTLQAFRKEFCDSKKT